MVRGIQPLSVMRNAWFGGCAPRTLVAWVVPSRRFHSGRNDATRFPEICKALCLTDTKFARSHATYFC